MGTPSALSENCFSNDTGASVFPAISFDDIWRPKTFSLRLCTFDSRVFLIEIDATASPKDDGWLADEQPGDSGSRTSLQIIFLGSKEVQVKRSSPAHGWKGRKNTREKKSF